MIKGIAYTILMASVIAAFGYKVAVSPVGRATPGYENVYIWGSEAAKREIRERELETDIPTGSTLDDFLKGNEAHAATIPNNPHAGYSIKTHPSHYR